MSKYIIFGAGMTGEIAMGFLGCGEIKCFIDNYKFGMELCHKPVKSFQELLEMDRTGCVIVVASKKYSEEMERQLIDAGIKNYIVFREDDVPHYWVNRRGKGIPYSKILAHYSIKKYKSIIILGANQFLHYLIEAIGNQHDISNIIGIVDPLDRYKDKSILGIPLISLEEAERKADCIIINIRRYENKYAEYIEDNQPGYDVIDIYDVDRFASIFWHPELEKFHDIHKGKRIWLIGNGPSLKIEDLETLHRHGEICFGFNRIDKIYDKTVWRADYIGMTDSRGSTAWKDTVAHASCPVFVSDEHHRTTDLYLDGVYYFHFIPEEYYPSMPRFSEDVRIGTYLGYTVVYDIGFQFANYMGASEIYLLGTDTCQVGDFTNERNHFIPDYYSEEERENFKRMKAKPEWEKMIKAYEKVEKFLINKGVRVFNATRGGALEVFKRVNFDDLFKT